MSIGREVSPVNKPTIVRLFVASLVAFFAAAFITAVTTIILTNNGSIREVNGEVSSIHFGLLGWIAAFIAIIAGFVMIAASIVQLISWIGAILNTWKLPSKGWFAFVLIAGLLSFGYVGMIGYVLAGPDGVAQEEEAAAIAAAPASTLAQP